MRADLRETPEYAQTAEFLRRLHEPAFGRPHALRDPHVTADGARIVVTGSVYDELDGLPRTALYAVEHGQLRAVPGLGGSARGARFSPDGATLAALSDHAQPGVFQLCLAADGEPVAAPAAPGTVEYLHWSPDGSRILLGVAGLGADLSGGQGSGVNLHTAGEEDRPAWLPRVEAGVTEAAWRSLWVYDVGSGELALVSPAGLNCWEACWCGPDRLVTVGSRSPEEDSWYAAALTLIDLGAGQHRELAAGPGQFGWPRGSPDGSRVAVVRAVSSDRWLVAGELLVVDVATGVTTVVDTAGVDVTWTQWLDTDRLGYLGRRRLDSVAGIATAASWQVSELFATGMGCGGWYPEGAFTTAGRVVTVQHGYRTPHQVMLDETALASVAHAGTDQLLCVAGSAEPVSWRAPDGLEIEGILCVPDGDGPFPLVVNIHGGPVWAFCDSWSMSYSWAPLLVARGYAVLNPNPRGSSGRGQEFARRVVHDMGGADTHDYLSGIDELVRRGIADPGRIGLIGRSYGGFMSSWLVTQSDRFAAAIPLSPVTDWYSQGFTSNIAGWGNNFLGADPEQPGNAVHERSPVLRASRVRTPCLNVAGAQDRCTPPGQAEEFHRALLAQGVESALVIYPGEGHGVFAYPALIDFLTRIVSWFDRFMPARSRVDGGG